MKIIYTNCLFLFLVFSICCKNNEEASVGIPIEFTSSYTINVKDTANLSDEKTKLIDATLNEDVTNNLNTIESYDVFNVKYKITNVLNNSTAEIITGSVSFDSTDVGGSDLLAEFTNVYPDSVSGDEQELDFSTDQLKAIGEILKSNNQVYWTVKTELSDTTSFTFKLIMELSLNIGI